MYKITNLTQTDSLNGLLRGKDEVTTRHLANIQMFAIERLITHVFTRFSVQS